MGLIPTSSLTQTRIIQQSNANIAITNISILPPQKARKTKTSLSSSTNQNDAKNDEEEDKSETESDRRKCKPVHKRVPTTKLSYDLMLAITPWIGNVMMPLSFIQRRACEGNFEI